MIQHFREFPPHLVQWLEAGTAGTEPAGKPSGAVLPPSLMVGAPGQPLPVSVGQSSLAVPPKTTVTTTSAVSLRSLSLPSLGSYALMCLTWCRESLSMAASMALMPPLTLMGSVEKLV